MKIIVVVLFSFFYPFVGYGQSYPDDYSRTKGKAVYVEVLGNGLVYSINYDQRFKNQFDGLGFKAGASYFAVSGTSVSTFPFGINYLLGKEGKYFEVGIGGTYLLASSNNSLFGQGGDRVYDRGFSGNMIFGYRSEPVDGGFLFRASLTPFLGHGVFWPLFAGLSVGYAF